MAEKVRVDGVEFVRLFPKDDDDQKFVKFCEDVAAQDVAGGADFSGVGTWTAAEVAAKPDAFRRVIHLFVDTARSKSVDEANVLVDSLLWGFSKGREELNIPSVLGFSSDDSLRECVLFCHRLSEELRTTIPVKRSTRAKQSSSRADTADTGVDDVLVEDAKKSSEKSSSADSTKKPVNEKPAEKSDEKVVEKVSEKSDDAKADSAKAADVKKPVSAEAEAKAEKSVSKAGGASTETKSAVKGSEKSSDSGNAKKPAEKNVLFSSAAK